MYFRIAFLTCFTLAMAVSVAAQTKSVTNASLESYQQQRLKADQDYRDNYARFGLPSPEEIDRRTQQSRIELEQLSAKLRAEDIERDRLAADQRANNRLTAAFSQPVLIERSQQYNNYYFWTHGRRHWFPARQQYVQPGYFAGGQFWPTGSRTPPRPMFVPTRH